MDFMTGVKKADTLELGEMLDKARIGQSVKVNGAIHTIRHMGDVAFVILRKRDGLLQCVYEEVFSFHLEIASGIGADGCERILTPVIRISIPPGARSSSSNTPSASMAAASFKSLSSNPAVPSS